MRGPYRTPEAGTRRQYVRYVGPWGLAALRLRYVPNAGGWHALGARSPYVQPTEAPERTCQLRS